MQKNRNEHICKSGRIRKVVIFLGILLAAVFCFAFYRGNQSRPLQGNFGKNFLIPLENQWKRGQDGADNSRVYRYQIPEQENLMLSLTASACPFDVYLGEEKIFHFENREKIGVRAAYFLELSEGSGGKELTMVVQGSASQGESICKSAYLGSHRAMIVYFLRRTVYTCFISVFLMLLGGMLIIANILLHGRKKQKKYGDIGFSYLGLFMIASGIWMLNDSQFLMLFTNRYWKLGLLSPVAFYFMPVFLLLFIQKILNAEGEQGQHSRYLRYFALPHLGMMVFYMILYAVGSAAKGYVMMAEHLLDLLTLGVCLWECIKDVRSKGSRQIREIVVGFGLFSLCCILAFVCFYFMRSIPYAGLYCLGFLIFSIILANAAIQRMVAAIQSGVESETYQRLAYLDLMTGLGNRTAYMEECKSMELPQICIMLDVNGLKSVNDNEGHQEGDELILAAARSVRDAFSPLGHCFRVGGDEFVVILDVKYQGMLANMMQGLKTAIEKENIHRRFPLSIACGYAVPKDEEDSFERVYREADEKMYARKREMKKNR